MWFSRPKQTFLLEYPSTWAERAASDTVQARSVGDIYASPMLQGVCTFGLPCALSTRRHHRRLLQLVPRFGRVGILDVDFLDIRVNRIIQPDIEGLQVFFQLLHRCRANNCGCY